MDYLWYQFCETSARPQREKLVNVIGSRSCLFNGGHRMALLSAGWGRMGVDQRGNLSQILQETL